ncbi:MAG TPA: YceI family protein, partial [Acidimicrobiia bacterium]|nr:YceI family protein [Acidimicrobiia bacterium]
MNTSTRPAIDKEDTMDRSPLRRRAWLFTLPLLLLALGATGLAWFFGREVPEEANIGVAGDVTTTAPAASTETSATSAALAVDGEWLVDTSIGDFSFAEATATFAGFRIEEELAGIGAATAIGRTPVLTGSLTVEEGVVTEGVIEADLTAIVSNETRRDDRIQGALNTDQNPIATFVLTEAVTLPGGIAEGSTFSLEVTGDLTINGVTNSVTIPLEGTVANGSVLLAGGVDLVFADYGVAVPTA